MRYKLLILPLIAVVGFSCYMDIGLWFGWFNGQFSGWNVVIPSHFVPSWTVSALASVNLMLICLCIYLLGQKYE